KLWKKSTTIIIMLGKKFIAEKNISLCVKEPRQLHQGRKVLSAGVWETFMYFCKEWIPKSVVMLFTVRYKGQEELCAGNKLRGQDAVENDREEQYKIP